MRERGKKKVNIEKAGMEGKGVRDGETNQYTCISDTAFDIINTHLLSIIQTILTFAPCNLI